MYQRYWKYLFLLITRFCRSSVMRRYIYSKLNNTISEQNCCINFNGDFITKLYKGAFPTHSLLRHSDWRISPFRDPFLNLSQRCIRGRSMLIYSLILWMPKIYFSPSSWGTKRRRICSLPYDRMQYVAKTKPKNSRFLNSFTKIKQNRYNCT